MKTGLNTNRLFSTALIFAKSGAIKRLVFKRGILSILMVVLYSFAYGQSMVISNAPIATTINPKQGVVLDLSNTTGASALGFLLPYMTTAQMNAIPATVPSGLLLFNYSTECYEIYSGSAWNPFWCLCTAGGTCTAGATSTSICTGSSISLTATPGGGASGFSTYTWTGPNGFTSSLQNPTITNAVLASAGTYTVTASSGCGSTPISTVTISVSAGTAVTATVGASPTCSGTTISLGCTTVGGATYSWSGPNGFTSTANNPSINNCTTAASGTYTVLVTEGTCTESSTVSVVVNQLPSAPNPINEIDSLTNLAYTGYCGSTCIAVGQTLQYSVTNTAGNTYTWAVTHGTILTGQGTSQISVQWTAAGSDEVSVTQTSNGCTSTAGDIFITVSSTCSCTYACGASSTFTTPSGVRNITFNVSGGAGGWVYSGLEGGNIFPDFGSATYGANVTGTYASVPGKVLNCYPGCQGSYGSSSAGGNGGGGGNGGDENGGIGCYSAGVTTCGGSASSVKNSSGGGGGGSDIRVGGTAHTNIIVCAGGGGADFNSLQSCPSCYSHNTLGCSNGGGNPSVGWNDYFTPVMPAGVPTSCGGNTTGQNGGWTDSQLGTEGGKGATVTTAGAPANAGVGLQVESADLDNCTGTASATCGGVATGATAGVNGVGGNGGVEGLFVNCGSGSTYCLGNTGGGGGGGYFGGGGGCGGGGGGGASYVGGAGVSGTSITSCSESGNGFITITW